MLSFVCLILGIPASGIKESMCLDPGNKLYVYILAFGDLIFCKFKYIRSDHC